METLLIIDGNSVVHRAYHALPSLTAKTKGLVNAVYGFFLVFLKALNDFKPDYVVVCFDSKPPTFRHKQFGEYKSGRKKAPQDLYDQIPMIKEILETFQTSFFEKQGFEADDLIGTIAKKASQKQVVPEIQTIIVSGDFDVYQLADNNINVYNLVKGVSKGDVFDPDKIKEKYGISPEQIVDFKALAGDSSDNIPGASGIGDATAVNLIQEYGSVDKLYKALESGGAWDMKQRIKEILIANKEQVLLSYDLAEINKNVDIDFNLKECAQKRLSLHPKLLEDVARKFDEYQFYTLKNRLKF